MRLGLYFGMAMAVILTLINLWTKPGLYSNHLSVAIVSTLLGSALSSLMFVWLVGLFINSNNVKQSTKINLEPDEMILFDTAANHTKAWESVGGWLYLTTKRLVFKSHSFNIQNHELSINLPDITKIERFKAWYLVNKGLMVSYGSQKTEKFVVQQIEDWLILLTKNTNLDTVAESTSQT